MKKSGTSYTIMYTGCPIIWKLMLQTQIYFIMTEADYIALSEDLRNTIHAINLLQENQEIGILYIFCTVLSILQGI